MPGWSYKPQKHQLHLKTKSKISIYHDGKSKICRSMDGSDWKLKSPLKIDEELDK